VSNSKAGIFVRRSLEGKSNMTTDSMLSKIEGRLYTLGEYIKQRYGDETFQNILNEVHSTGEQNS